MPGHLDAIADAVILAAKGFASRAVDRLAVKLDALERRIEAIPAGAKGDAGPAGKDGLDGAQGPRGEPGPAGKPGPPGKDGESIEGPPGANGRDGKDGADGEPGQQGERGAQGAPGEPGQHGRDGANGKDGAPGERGLKGDAGDRGADGLSAFEIAKRSGFSGSEGEWLLWLRGKDGRDGANGADGQNGQDGRDGLKGETGRDALEIDVLDGIDERRSYPRGTFAAVNGGMLRAARATDPIEGGRNIRDAGWTTIMRGIASDVETLEDGGRFAVRTVTYSDGAVDVQRRQTAMQINRGVWSASVSYQPGDIVSSNNSQWVAMAETRSAPPGNAWRLCVRNGRDGRDRKREDE